MPTFNILEFASTMFVSLLGMMLYFVWKARLYFIDGSFTFAVWKKENLQRIGYAVILLLLLITLLQIEPETEKVLQFIGISFDSDISNLSPILLGASIGAMIMGADKTFSKINEKQ